MTGKGNMTERIHRLGAIVTVAEDAIQACRALVELERFQAMKYSPELWAMVCATTRLFKDALNGFEKIEAEFAAEGARQLETDRTTDQRSD